MISSKIKFHDFWCKMESPNIKKTKIIEKICLKIFISYPLTFWIEGDPILGKEICLSFLVSQIPGQNTTFHYDSNLFGPLRFTTAREHFAIRCRSTRFLKKKNRPFFGCFTQKSRIPVLTKKFLRLFFALFLLLWALNRYKLAGVSSCWCYPPWW